MLHEVMHEAASDERRTFPLRVRYQRERDAERLSNGIMASSIRTLESDTARAAKQSADAQRRVAQVTKERDRWIERAQRAETRTERMSAEKEVEECVKALTELRSAGF